MHISLEFWECGCPECGDAHITVTPARRMTLLSKRPNLAGQVTLLSEPTVVSHVNFARILGKVSLPSLASVGELLCLSGTGFLP